MVKGKWMIFVVILVIVPSLVLAQKKCLYVSTTTGFAPLASDPIVNKFVEWGLDLTYINTTEAALYFEEDYAPFDFVFVDEVVPSSSLEPINLLEGHIIPLLTTENYAPRATILGYLTNQQAVNIAAEAVKIHNGDHPLAAGFATGSEVVINDGAGANEDLIPNLPEIDFIPIAESKSWPGLYVAYGVDAGGTTVNGVPITHRGAVLGFHENGYSAINENGFKLLKAAIDWITEDLSAVEKVSNAVPETWLLAQNYPNPFNPATTIEFQLEKSAHTTLSVYNSQGQLMTALVDEDLNAGTHRVTFDAENYSSGVYFYSIQSGDFSHTRKMILMR